MNKVIGLLSLFSVGLLWGCATSSEWGDSTANFNDTQLGPDLFEVEFRAAPYESIEKAHDLALFRAAELVEKHGFASFEVMRETASPTPHGTKSPGTALTSGSVQTDGGGAYFTGHTTYTPGQIYDSHGSSTQLLVRGLQGKPQGVTTLDALTVQSAIRQKYRLP